ncbi:MAG TPA: sulfate ABC transporter permease subunit CysT [Candidatus Baltobacteraceae bacterium]|jgi:sulfate transport system permease protein|nr:sulfate ABC transporter permease subunit CysT [Candidatus Baltobacteraceae bacterium]
MALSFATRRNQNVIPGAGASLALSMCAVTCIVIVPLAAIVLSMRGLSASDLWHLATSSRALDSYRVTFGSALIAAAIDAVVGLGIAWVLVRYRFFAQRVLDLAIDIPFALPTAVAGIALATLYSDNGWLGSIAASHGIHVAFTPLGIVIAMVFVGLPFAVRTVSSVLAELPPELDEAAETLGSQQPYTFLRVTLPMIFPAVLVGFSMALARGIGEYGSVIFIAGNLPHKTEITAILIITRLEEYDYQGATALAAVMLAVSFALIFIINVLQRRARWPSL